MNRSIQNRSFLWATAALLFLNACSKEEMGGSSGKKVEICPELIETKAAQLWGTYNSTDTDQLMDFGVYACYKGTDLYLGDAAGGATVSRTDELSEWNYTPELYWPTSGTLDFYGYVPVGQKLNLSGGVIPVVDFTVQDGPARQVDLLLAVPQKDRSSGLVKLPFRHALTKITFSARAERMISGKDFIVENIQLTNASNSGTHPMDATQPWTVDANPAKRSDYMLTTSAGLVRQPLSTEYFRLSDKAGTLLLLPQKLNNAMRVEVTYGIYNGATRLEEKKLSLQLDSASPDWEQGKAIHYNLLIPAEGASLTVVVKVEDWTFQDRGVNLGGS